MRAVALSPIQRSALPALNKPCTGRPVGREVQCPAYVRASPSPAQTSSDRTSTMARSTSLDMLMPDVRAALVRVSSMEHTTTSLALCCFQGSYDLLAQYHHLPASDLDWLLPMLFGVAILREATAAALAVERKQGVTRNVVLASSAVSIAFYFTKCFYDRTCSLAGCDILAPLMRMGLTLLDPLCAVLNTADNTVSAAETLASYDEDDNSLTAAAPVATPSSPTAGNLLSNNMPLLAVVAGAAVAVGGDVLRDHLADNWEHFKEFDMTWTTMALLLTSVLRNHRSSEARTATSTLALLSQVFHQDVYDMAGTHGNLLQLLNLA